MAIPQGMWDLFPNQGFHLSLLHWKHGVSTTGPPEKSLKLWLHLLKHHAGSTKHKYRHTLLVGGLWDTASQGTISTGQSCPGGTPRSRDAPIPAGVTLKHHLHASPGSWFSTREPSQTTCLQSSWQINLSLSLSLSDVSYAGDQCSPVLKVPGLHILLPAQPPIPVSPWALSSASSDFPPASTAPRKIWGHPL